MDPDNLPVKPATGQPLADPAAARRYLMQLVSSEKKYRLIADSISDVIWVLDIQALSVIYVSPSVERLVGYSRATAQNMALQQFLTPASMEIIRTALAENLARKHEEAVEHIRLELQVRHKNGSLVWIEVTPRFLRDANREPVGILGVARDCTERLNSAEALRQSEEWYRTILDNIEEGYCEFDLAGNILFANDAACLISGYPQEELTGMSYKNIMDAENAARVYQSFSRVYRTGKPTKGFDYELIKKDGNRRQVETSIMLITDKNNRAVGFRGVGRDITQRKMEERKLKQEYKKLDRRVAERTAELARMNRDLEDKTRRLEEANIALKVLLQQKDENKKHLEEQMMTNIMELIIPALEKIQNIGLTERQTEYARMIQANLNDITSPFLHTLSQRFSLLTPTEIQIANHIKHGKTTKEIAGLMNLAASTIDFHRKNIRKKLMIQNQKVNLRTHLLSIES